MTFQYGVSAGDDPPAATDISACANVVSIERSRSGSARYRWVPRKPGKSIWSWVGGHRGDLPQVGFERHSERYVVAVFSLYATLIVIGVQQGV